LRKDVLFCVVEDMNQYTNNSITTIKSKQIRRPRALQRHRPTHTWRDSGFYRTIPGSNNNILSNSSTRTYADVVCRRPQRSRLQTIAISCFAKIEVYMCRWLAYLGSAIPLEDVLVKPNHSLIDQSLRARQLFLPNSSLASEFLDSAFPTNGDGFGMAWAGREGTLGQYRQIGPAWDNQNLQHLAAQLESGCFLAHVRAAPGGTVSEQNCHPFVHNDWMFQHNGD